MKRTKRNPTGATLLSAKSNKHGHVLVINPGLLLYVGLHGSPSERTFGALTLYFSLGEPLSVQLQGEPWQSCNDAVVPPGVPHQIATQGKLYCVLMIETENIDIAALLQRLDATNADGTAIEQLGTRIRALVGPLSGGARRGNLAENELEGLLFDTPLPRRQLDPRIQKVVDRINSHPNESRSATDYAAEVALSCSRFIHLFNAELGVTFRGFKVWKRARNFLGYVTNPSNLTDLALNIGYPDASHFSHSIRRVYGLKPKDIFAGSRRLRLYS